MKRDGIHRPTIEDLVEISGIETLHPGGFALTRRTAELAALRDGIKVLDVSSGRGTQSIFYASEYGAHVTGLDISPDMIAHAEKNAENAGVENLVNFVQGDSQNLPFADNSFDVVINECAVGIPDDSQKVLNEMARVAKPGGNIVIHESTWRKSLSDQEKYELTERYGTTPLEFSQWLDMLAKAGVENITTELEQWSKPEMFWKVRKDREVKSYSKVLSLSEKMRTIGRILKSYGVKGIIKAFINEKKFYTAVIDGKLGYCLYKGSKKT